MNLHNYVLPTYANGLGRSREALANEYSIVEIDVDSSGTRLATENEPSEVSLKRGE